MLSGIAKSLRDRWIYRLSEIAYCVNPVLFDEKMKIWKDEGSHALLSFINSVPFAHWTNAHSPSIRYGEMFSNVAESFNAWIDAGRGLPIVPLVEYVREKIMNMLEKRRNESLQWNGVLCPKRDKMWREYVAQSASWITLTSTEGVISVLSDPSVVVDLDARTCSCGMWQVNGFPCNHVAAALRRSKKTLAEIVDPLFHVSSFRTSYSFPVYPVPSMLKHQISLEIAPQGINPPITRRPSGRPKKKRFRSRGESEPVQIKHCGRCGQEGHNMSTCNNPIG